MAHDKFFGVCENKCFLEINPASVGAAKSDHTHTPEEIGAAKADHTHDASAITGAVSIANGGTGATTAAQARANLGAAAADHTHEFNVDVTATVAIENGGTGGATATAARTNLELLKETILYDNASGTDSTITLSDYVSNYKYLGIYSETWVGNQDVVIYSDYTKIIPNDGVEVSVTLGRVHAGEQNGLPSIIARTAIVNVIGNTITFEHNTAAEIRDTTATWLTDSVVKITRVVGYSY